MDLVYTLIAVGLATFFVGSMGICAFILLCIFPHPGHKNDPPCGPGS